MVHTILYFNNLQHASFPTSEHNIPFWFSELAALGVDIYDGRKVYTVNANDVDFPSTFTQNKLKLELDEIEKELSEISDCES
jgi:hypothetical protein